jgi:hypothetical protein
MRIELYNNILKNIPEPIEIPCFNTKGKLIIVLIEYRIMDEIQWVINAALRVYQPEEIGFAIVHGTDNANYINDKYSNWKNILLVNTGHSNLNRGTYSALLKMPQLWENFLNWEHALIYQTDALLIRKIDDIYFNYDYIGSPWTQSNQCAPYCGGNGGFSLRRIKAMIEKCERFRNTVFEQIHRGNEDIFFCSFKDYKYPPINSALHKSFAVERVKHPQPVGCHQIRYCWDMNNNEFDTFIKYLKDNLIDNNKTIRNIKTLEEASTLSIFDLTKDSISLYINDKNKKKSKKYITTFNNRKTKKNKLSNVITYNPNECTEILEKLRNKQNVYTFDLYLKNIEKNNWVIDCKNDYQILLCENDNPDSVVKTYNIQQFHQAHIHKKKEGVKYYTDNDYVYIIFYPGYEEGGKSMSDVNAPWGNHWNHCSKLPKHGAVILKSYKNINKEKLNNYDTTNAIIKPNNNVPQKPIPVVDKRSEEEKIKDFLIKYKLEDSKYNILIYDLFSGVGYYNQMFSLEIAIYWAYTSNRHLIINQRHPLVACGKPMREMGSLIDYISNNFEKYLPHGFTWNTYTDCTPCNINEINTKCKMSNCVFIDKELDKENNKDDIKEFTHFRTQISSEYLDNLYDSKVKIVSFNKSNASRIFMNFYTTKDKYKIMNDITLSLSNYNDTLTNVYNNIKERMKYKRYISIHLRFGDYHKSVDSISSSNEEIKKNLYTWLEKNNTTNKLPIGIMTDRKDNPFFNELKEKYDIFFIDEQITDDDKIVLKEKYKEIYNADFLIQKKICEDADIFIGSQGSTVSTHIQYINYLNGKPYELYTHIKSAAFDNDELMFKVDNSKKWSWKQKNYLGGHPVSWSLFFNDNIIRNKV